MASRKKSIPTDDAPLEAHKPTVIRIGGGVAESASVRSLDGLETLPGSIVHGCDGEDVYVWWVRPNKKGTGLRVTEVSPGLDKKNTRLRQISDASQLTYSENKKSLEQLVERWTKALLGDLVPEKPAKKSANNTADESVDDDDVEEDIGDDNLSDETDDGDDW